MNNFFRFIFSKLFLKQLVIAVVILFVLYIGAVIGLRIFTHHGQTVQVPDLKGYNEMQVKRVLESNEFRYEIIDSVYTSDVLPGTVYDQIPTSGEFVKEDRKIFLIMNAVNSELVDMPSLRNVSLRQARVMIEHSGLKLGKVIYVASEYKGLVLNQLMNDTLVYGGIKVPKWSEVDIHVGKGLGDTNIPVPFLRGAYWIDAKQTITSLNFNEGSIINDATVVFDEPNDSAMVWKQYPQPDVVTQAGKGIDVWLTMDTAVVYAADSTLRKINIVINE